MERFKVKKTMVLNPYQHTYLEGTKADNDVIIEKGAYAEIFPTIYCIDDEEEKEMREMCEDQDYVSWFLNTFMTIAFTKKPDGKYDNGIPFTQYGDEPWIYSEDFNFMELPNIIKKFNLEVVTCTK